MDAVHSVPLLITRRETCDEALLQRTLADYDAKWGEASRTRLLAVYQSAIAGSP